MAFPDNYVSPDDDGQTHTEFGVEYVWRNNKWEPSAADVDFGLPPYDAGKAIVWDEDEQKLENSDFTLPEYTEKARQWAENPEDVPVQGEEYSAYHWAQKAEAGATPVPLDGAETREVFVYDDIVGQYTFELVYAPGDIDVHFNGVKLKNGDDYIAEDGATIVLINAATSTEDFLEVVKYGKFSVANHYTKAETYSKAQSYSQAQVDAAIAAAVGMPPGSISAFGGGSAPTGWLLCDGSAVNRETYAGLFSVIGSNYGPGNSVTTFNVPDLRGEFLRGADKGRGVDAGRALGSTQTRSDPDEFFGCYFPLGSQDNRRRVAGPVPTWDGNFSTSDSDGDSSSGVPADTDDLVDNTNNFTKGLKVNNMDTHTSWDNYPHNVAVNYIIKV